MRLFHQLAFDGYVNGTANVYSDPALTSVLGTADQLVIGGYTTQVSGTGPTIAVEVEHSIDDRVARALGPRRSTVAFDAAGLGARHRAAP